MEIWWLRFSRCGRKDGTKSSSFSSSFWLSSQSILITVVSLIWLQSTLSLSLERPSILSLSLSSWLPWIKEMLPNCCERKKWTKALLPSISQKKKYGQIALYSPMPFGLKYSFYFFRKKCNKAQNNIIILPHSSLLYSVDAQQISN